MMFWTRTPCIPFQKYHRSAYQLEQTIDLLSFRKFASFHTEIASQAKPDLDNIQSMSLNGALELAANRRLYSD